jgi:ABC-2 type transport system ATP-binding protein
MSFNSISNEASAIEVTDLRKAYGSTEAVRAVSFTVARGEVFCLLGPNGAGKTTIVEILEGYRTRTSGSVTVLGIDPATGARRLREQVGIVLQQCGVQNDLTVAELAQTLYLSPGTVPNHLSSVMQKLDARNRAEAVRMAEERGWL